MISNTADHITIKIIDVFGEGEWLRWNFISIFK